MKITLEDSIAEIKRELKMREKVYPNLISSGKLNKDQANKQYLRLKYALDQLINKSEKQSGKQRSLFK